MKYWRYIYFKIQRKIWIIWNIDEIFAWYFVNYSNFFQGCSFSDSIFCALSKNRFSLKKFSSLFDNALGWGKRLLFAAEQSSCSLPALGWSYQNKDLQNVKIQTLLDLKPQELIHNDVLTQYAQASGRRLIRLWLQPHRFSLRIFWSILRF